MLVNHLLFLDISGGEFIVILLVAFFVFGPKRLPEIARKLGRTMNEIKSVSGELTREFKNETRNIATELKAARDSANIDNIKGLDINHIMDTKPAEASTPSHHSKSELSTSAQQSKSELSTPAQHSKSELPPLAPQSNSETSSPDAQNKTHLQKPHADDSVTNVSSNNKDDNNVKSVS